MAQQGRFITALSNNSIFANTYSNDVLLYSTCNMQQICIGVQSGPTVNATCVIGNSGTQLQINGNVTMSSNLQVNNIIPLSNTQLLINSNLFSPNMLCNQSICTSNMYVSSNASISNNLTLCNLTGSNTVMNTIFVLNTLATNNETCSNLSCITSSLSNVTISQTLVSASNVFNNVTITNNTLVYSNVQIVADVVTGTRNFYMTDDPANVGVQIQSVVSPAPTAAFRGFTVGARDVRFKISDVRTTNANTEVLSLVQTVTGGTDAKVGILQPVPTAQLHVNGNQVGESHVHLQKTQAIIENQTTVGGTGYLQATASYSASNFVQLTSASTPNAFGQYYYNVYPGLYWTLAFDLQIGSGTGTSAGGISFGSFVYANSISTTTGGSGPGTGYAVVFNEFSNFTELRYDNVPVTSVMNYPVVDNNWHTVSIRYVNGVFTVTWDGTAIIAYDDSVQTTNGNRARVMDGTSIMGFSAGTSAAAAVNNHRIRNVTCMTYSAIATQSNMTLNVPLSTRTIGMGVTNPTQYLDIHYGTSNSTYTSIKTGNSMPMYAVNNPPTWGFNTYFNSNTGAWINGSLNTSNTSYGGALEFDHNNGIFNMRIASSKTANAAFIGSSIPAWLTLTMGVGMTINGSTIANGDISATSNLTLNGSNFRMVDNRNCAFDVSKKYGVGSVFVGANVFDGVANAWTRQNSNAGSLQLEFHTGTGGADVPSYNFNGQVAGGVNGGTVTMSNWAVLKYGQLGIGTASPEGILDARGKTLIGPTTGTGIVASTQLHVRQLAATGDTAIVIENMGNRVYHLRVGNGLVRNVIDSLASAFTWEAGGASVDATGSTELARIAGASGFMGIGTSNPDIRLDVCGSANGIGVATSAANKGRHLYMMHDGNNAYIRAGGSSNIIFQVQSTPAGTYGVPSYTSGMFINSNAVYIPGALSKGTGSFDITHPDPLKAVDGYRLRHCFVESPTRGDNIYRYSYAMLSNETKTLELPSYFSHLNEQVQVWLNATTSFGRGYGTYDAVKNTVLLRVDTEDTYNILIIGTRKDQIARDHFDGGGGVEYKSKSYI